MTEAEIQNILEKQHKFFQTGQTLPVAYRIEQLQKLKDSIIRHEPDLNLALKADLGKSETESYMCEIGLTLSELTWMEKHIRRLLEMYGIKLIVLAGFMSILSREFTTAYDHRIINVHPSLIPSFCGEGFYGLHVHEAALAKGVRITGATVHFVNEIPDGGDIIEQKAVRVFDGDTPERLQKRVMRQAEWKILPAATETVARKILKGEI